MYIILRLFNEIIAMKEEKKTKPEVNAFYENNGKTISLSISFELVIELRIENFSFLYFDFLFNILRSVGQLKISHMCAFFPIENEPQLLVISEFSGSKFLQASIKLDTCTRLL